MSAGGAECLCDDPGAAVGNGANAGGAGVDGAIPKELLDNLVEGVFKPLGGRRVWVQ
jgi:hypothetical protein